jgi:hypothetical protein
MQQKRQRPVNELEVEVEARDGRGGGARSTSSKPKWWHAVVDKVEG